MHPIAFLPELWVGQSDYFLTNSGLFMHGGQAVLIDPGVRRDEIDAMAECARAQ